MFNQSVCEDGTTRAYAQGEPRHLGIALVIDAGPIHERATAQKAKADLAQQLQNLSVNKFP